MMSFLRELRVFGQERQDADKGFFSKGRCVDDIGQRWRRSFLRGRCAPESTAYLSAVLLRASALSTKLFDTRLV